MNMGLDDRLWSVGKVGRRIWKMGNYHRPVCESSVVR